MNKLLSSFTVVVIILLSVACSSTTRDYKGVYEASEKIESLDVPPGLDKPPLADDSSLAELGKSVKSISIYEENLKDKQSKEFEPQYKGMKFKRDGSLYWLEANEQPNVVWDDLHTFFVKLGFEIEVDNAQIGYMQTGWLENRVDVPGGWVREYLGMLYSTDLMDRYRIRLEWDSDVQISRVFIIHQGLKEVVVSGDNPDSVTETQWVIRPSDPELEVEMIMRFMAYRGISESLAEKQIAEVKTEERTKLVEKDGKNELIITDSFQRSWRQISIAVDRLGYLVEDRNRSAGVLYIRLPDSFEIKNDGGFFSSETAKPEQYKYLIILEDKGDKTLVTVKTNGDDAKDFAKVQQKMLKDLKASIL
jgi:outer membrane protein assembly factor BamC